MNTSAYDSLRYQSEPVSAWLSLLDHPEEQQRRRASEKLLEISTAISAVLPALSSVLKDLDTSVRARAATSLGELGSKMLSAVPTLRTALRRIVLTDNDEMVRVNALQSLARIGPESQGDVPSLLTSLQDELPYVRLSAANALAEMGPRAIDALPALTAVALRDPVPRVRLEAAVALWRIDRRSVRVIPVLMEALEDPDEVSRWIAADCLGDIGAEAREAVPALQAALRGEFRSRLIKMSIELALQRIDPNTAPAE
jgi:HEAT repeat protein